MPRPRNQQATRARSGGGFIVGLFVGLVLGLGIALAVAFYLNKTPIPFASKGKPAGTETSPEPGKAAVAGMPQGSGTGAERPKFDFYKILPGGEETVSEKELKDRLRGAREKGGAGSTSREVYFVQAGAFQNPADADNQKARLAILGLESSVEPASLPDKGTWYRVRLGPYTKLDEINRVRQALAQNGIDASLIKLKDSPAKGN